MKTISGAKLYIYNNIVYWSWHASVSIYQRTFLAVNAAGEEQQAYYKWHNDCLGGQGTHTCALNSTLVADVVETMGISLQSESVKNGQSPPHQNTLSFQQECCVICPLRPEQGGSMYIYNVLFIQNVKKNTTVHTKREKKITERKKK